MQILHAFVWIAAIRGMRVRSLRDAPIARFNVSFGFRFPDGVRRQKVNDVPLVLATGGVGFVPSAVLDLSKTQFAEADQRDSTCPVLLRKKICFRRRANHLYQFARPVPQRGGSRSSRTRGGMRWTWAVLLTRARYCGRRSRVVLTPRRWRQVGGGHFASDGVNKPITGESTI
jgi:hypothetical protein